MILKMYTNLFLLIKIGAKIQIDQKTRENSNIPMNITQFYEHASEESRYNKNKIELFVS